MKNRHFIFGLLASCGGMALLLGTLRTELEAQSSGIAEMNSGLQKWMLHQKTHRHATSDFSISVALDDPIFLLKEDGTYRQCGLVSNINGTDTNDPIATADFDVSLYDDAIARCPDGYVLEYHTTPTSLDWVGRTMIPKKRQKEIAELLQSEWATQKEELVGQLKPIIERGVRTAFKAVETELPDILRKHRPEFRALGERYETDILKADLLPLVKEEVLPIVEEEAKPVARELGQALWQRLSLWSFTWRYLYDKTPLSDKQAFKKEFQRFLDEEAMPELKGRSKEFQDVVERIFKRAMENPRVRQVLKDEFREIAEDPELHRLIWSVVREAVLENETLKSEIDSFMKDQETRAAVKLAGSRMEPLARKIGDMIFGSRETGITPEFSRVLRAQILKKDRRWFILKPVPGELGRTPDIFVDSTDSPMIYPMGFGGTNQSPLTPVRDAGQ